MANEIFDRETMLDLLVNIIPLFILGFFIVAFLVSSPFGIDPLTSSIQFGLIAIPFVLLTVLTYFAGRAVAGSENNAPVYLPGQASVRGAEPLEVPGDEDDESELNGDSETAAAELENGGASSEESEADTDADGESDLDATAAPSQESETDPDDESETDDDSDATDTPDDADRSS